MPDMFPLNGSSQLAKAGYEQGEIYVKFHTGATYAYLGTEDDLARLRADPSAAKGHFFDETIRKTRSYRKVSV